MKRTVDATFINKVANHKEVRPFLMGDGKFDMTDFLEDTRNFAFINDDGGFVLHNQADGVYEVHTMFLPNHKSNILQNVAESMDYMFTRTDCHTLLTQVPDSNDPAMKLSHAVGFKPLFRREDTPLGPTQYFRLTLAEWVQNNKDLEHDGEWFHNKLEEAKFAKDSTLPTHPYDPAHERAVGAAVRMMKAGNPFKAVDYYNEWASFAGYLPVRLLSVNPITVDVLDAVVEMKDGELEILKCR